MRFLRGQAEAEHVGIGGTGRNGSLRRGFWGVAKLGAERAGLLWKWQCVAIGGMLRPAWWNGVPVTIKARWNVHVTLTTALQMGLHAVSKVVRVTGCLGYEDHTQ